VRGDSRRSGHDGARVTAAPRTFYLIAAAGIPNFGDDAIARYWIAYLRTRYPGCRIVLDAFDASVAALLHPTAVCVDHVWRLAEQADPSQPAELRQQLRARWSAEAPLPMRERQLLDCARTATAMHVLGGGYINDLWPRNRHILAVCAALADVQGTRVFATGLGLEPLAAESAAQLAGLLDALSHIDLRDMASVRALEPHVAPELGGRLSCLGDDLLQEDVTKLLVLEDAPPRMHLCVQDEFFGERATAEQLQQWLLGEVFAFRRTRPDAQVVCWELRPVSDARISAWLRGMVPGVVLVPFEQLWTEGFAFGREDHLLSSRFHFQLVAAAAGLCGTAISWSGYYDTKLGSLRGFSRWTIYHLGGEEAVRVRFVEPPIAPERAEAIGKRKQALVASVLYPSVARRATPAECLRGGLYRLFRGR